MEKELLNTFDKELLLKDICARLPYGVKIQVPYEDGSGYFDEIVWEVNNDGHFHVNGWGIEYEYVKPYLFPLSSMTEEQKMFLKQQNWCIAISTSGTVETTIEGFDWLNKNHFDYRNLIDKNLAIDATGLNIY